MPFINGIGPMELIIILIIALIVVGPGKLPEVGASLGKSIREFRKAATDVKESVSLEPAAPAPVAPAPAVAVAAAPPPPAPVAVPPAPVVAASVAAVGAVAVEAAPVAVVEAAPAAVPQAAAEAAPADWPAEVTPVDEQQPTASA